VKCLVEKAFVDSAMSGTAPDSRSVKTGTGVPVTAWPDCAPAQSRTQWPFSLLCFVSQVASVPKRPDDASGLLARQYANCGPSTQWKYCDFTIPVIGMRCCSNLKIGLKSLYAETRRPVRASGRAQSCASVVSAGPTDPASHAVCPPSRATPCRGSLHRGSEPTAMLRSSPPHRSRPCASAPGITVVSVLSLVIATTLGIRISSTNK
jgi:hypothetical protein